MTPAQITEDNHGRLRLASGNVEFGAAKRLDFYEVEQITPGPFLAGLTREQARGLMRELAELRWKYQHGATGQEPRSEKREALRARAVALWNGDPEMTATVLGQRLGVSGKTAGLLVHEAHERGEVQRLPSKATRQL